MIDEQHRVGIDTVNIDDVYSPDYTAHIDRLRHEAALVLARIAMRHIFATGETTHDPNAIPPREAPQRQPFFFRKRLIEYLHDRGDLFRRGTNYWPTAGLMERAGMSEADYFGAEVDSPTLRAMKDVESIAGGVLQGVDGLALLKEEIGAEETWRTWQYVMVDAVPKQACNSLVARALDRRLRAGTPTVVFEGGAGLGATLREALRIEGFSRRAKNIELYGFTDINRPLMRRAKEMLERESPGLLSVTRFDRVDLDELAGYDDLPYLRDGSVDIIIFENVLHDVERLHKVLSSSRRILKKGGWLVFTSGIRVRPGLFFPCELLQSTLHSYYRAELDPPRRVNVGYPSIEEWTASLIGAGFPVFRIYPNPEQREKWPFGGIIAQR